MTAVKHQPCRRCTVEGPWRFDDDGHCIGKCSCITTATAQAEAQRLTADAHTRAFQAAKAIITDAAHGMAELNGNVLREAFEQAQIPSPIIGAAFSACRRDGVIAETGRFVQSTEASTRHRIAVWGSLVYRSGSAVAS